MSKRNRKAKTSEQIKNEQIAIILGELENDIQHFKITVQKKDEHLNKFARIIKVTKTEYQNLHRENTELKKYILKKKKIWPTTTTATTTTTTPTTKTILSAI